MTHVEPGCYQYNGKEEVHEETLGVANHHEDLLLRQREEVRQEVSPVVRRDRVVCELLLSWCQLGYIGSLRLDLVNCRCVILTMADPQEYFL